MWKSSIRILPSAANEEEIEDLSEAIEDITLYLSIQNHPARARGTIQDAARVKDVIRKIRSTGRRMFDVICAGLGLVVLAPIFAMIAVAIKWDDGGPVLYSQTRVGKNLGRFRLLKFRSMFTGASESNLLTARHDPRVTRLGRFLRRHKLDELPQLINVVKGDMQLVGVRPQTERYVGAFPSEYRILLQEPPGIADMASYIFRNEENVLKPEPGEEQELHYIKKILPRKLQLSLQYYRSRTFFSDIKILYCTVIALISSATCRPPLKFRASSLPDREFLKPLSTGFSTRSSAAITQKNAMYSVDSRRKTPLIDTYHFGPWESDRSHQNDELDRIYDST